MRTVGSPSVASIGTASSKLISPGRTDRCSGSRTDQAKRNGSEYDLGEGVHVEVFGWVNRRFEGRGGQGRSGIMGLQGLGTARGGLLYAYAASRFLLYWVTRTNEKLIEAELPEMVS
jgi:hypothetical protein